MREDTALKLYRSGFWKRLDARHIAEFALREPRLCMPFGEMHAAIESALGRPVWTHEFVDPKSLLAELHGEKPRATMGDVLNKIPETVRHKTLIIEANP